jgi:protein phosphatase
MTRIAVPDLSLVVLIGASGSGKSTFAAKHFLPTEIVSSDVCRGLVSDDQNDMAATAAAFDVLHLIASKRLEAGRLTVIDATNVQRESRAPLVRLARDQYCLPVAIVLDIPERLCHERNRSRPDRTFGPHVVRNHAQQLRHSLKGLEREGFRRVFVLRSPEEVEAAEVVREPLWTDRRTDTGPFDIIGDVHGCFDELVMLLDELGYRVAGPDGSTAAHPDGRRAIFLGDLIDRGPNSPGVLRMVMGMVRDGSALCVPGNHENKLVRKLKGRDVQITHGLAETLEQLDHQSPEFRAETLAFLDGLVSHFVLDEGRLVVAHAGMKERMQGRAAGAVRDFALYGETTGETDEFGLPVRYPWANDYRGSAIVVYGHTPVPEPAWVNKTICVDTGCVFGGHLTALRYPERELVAVPAARVYYEPAKPFEPSLEAALAAEAEKREPDLLDVDDVLGKRQITTRFSRTVTIREENAAAALEVMSRFAVDPRWLIYLPPTMAPPATSKREGLLEHPAEAFAEYRHDGVPNVICEEKHMGSRAIVIVCREPSVAIRRFGAQEEADGVCFTRTGRPFFGDPTTQADLLTRVREAATRAGIWEGLNTDWFAMDCELMPWSAKAEDLRRQYAPVGASGSVALAEAERALSAAATRGVDGASLGPMAERTRERAAMVDRFADAYRRYCWPVGSLDDLKLAPFQLLAAEGTVHALKDHSWHLEVLTSLCAADEGLLQPTRYLAVDVTDPPSQEAAERWWDRLTETGGEGMVVKPASPVAPARRGIPQPGVKVRGREYLRVVYGPEYTAPQNLARLRERALGHKRSLAMREFALGIEALERFVRNEPLYRVHECVFGVLALESEPVDPAL